MKEKFVSKALEANLAETRYKNIVIPEEHQQFIQLSNAYYGINKRASECIIEYQHPFSNRKFVVEQLREMVLSDFWFYNGLPDPDKAFTVVLNIYDTLLQNKLPEDLQIQIIKTLLEFIKRLSEQPEILTRTISKSFSILKNNLDKNETAFIKSSKFFIKYLTKTITINDFGSEIFDITKRIFIKNIEYWNNTASIEQWYLEKTNLFHRDYTVEIGTTGKPYFDTLRLQIEKSQNWNELIDNCPDFDDIALRFVDLTSRFDNFIEKFYYTFYLLHLPGMVQLKERLIWNINKLLRNAMDELTENDLPDFTDKMFALSEELKAEHTSSVLDFLLTLGKKVIDMDSSEDKHIVNYFEKKLIDFGFETPGIVYVNEDWQIHAAVTAVRLGKTCVVNCTDLLVNEFKKECSINGITFHSGNTIAIDGHFGNIYKGNYPVELTEVKAGI